MLRRLIAVFLAAVTAAPALAAAPATPGGAHSRVTEQLTSRALGREVTVTVLVPPGPPGRRHPVLYLLHPEGAGPQDWIDRGELLSTLRGTGLLVVLVDAGTDGWYADWRQGPLLERHHLDELVPWVDGRFPTIARREARAIAGAGTGALGALSYAARRPGLFGSVASLSGPVDPAGGAPGSRPPDDLWGAFATDEVRWRDHNPADLAVNLGRSTVWLGSSPNDGDAFRQSLALHDHLTSAGIAHEWQPTAGGGGWEGWGAALRAALPSLSPGDRPGGPAITSFDFRWASSDTVVVHGWRFTSYRNVDEFTDLAAVRATGMVVRGSGVLDVTTPPTFHRRHRYRVTTGWRKSNRSHSSTWVLRPGDDRRLRFTVKLDASHRSQEYTPLGHADRAVAGADHWATSDVRIHDMGPDPHRPAVER